MKTKGCLRIIVSFVIALTILSVASVSTGQVIFSCPFQGGSGDHVDRGFYLQSYPGSNLGTVQLGYWSPIGGSYSAFLTARLGAYDGPIIGSTQTKNFNLTASVQTLVTYDFGGASVPFGSTVTFSQSGPDDLYYDVGVGPCPGIIQTDGTSAPLDVFRRDTVGVVITQVPEPSSLLLLAIGISGIAICSARLSRRSRRLVSR